MSIIKNAPTLQPRPTSTLLSNGFEFAITGGMWCPHCGDDIRSVDAEALDGDGSMRLVCKCGHLVVEYGRRT
jgi:hypothetical protein